MKQRGTPAKLRRVYGYAAPVNRKLLRRQKVNVYHLPLRRVYPLKKMERRAGQHAQRHPPKKKHVQLQKPRLPLGLPNGQKPKFKNQPYVKPPVKPRQLLAHPKQKYVVERKFLQPKRLLKPPLRRQPHQHVQPPARVNNVERHAVLPVRRTVPVPKKNQHAMVLRPMRVKKVA